jgi:hypothetical protein
VAVGLGTGVERDGPADPRRGGEGVEGATVVDGVVLGGGTGDIGGRVVVGAGAGRGSVAR